jgi:hypothetical protein
MPERNLAHRPQARDADACEGAELAHPDPNVERIVRRLCRLEYVEAMHWQALRRLADERERLEAQLAAIEEATP